MNTLNSILVPTDFSPCSDRALQLGCELAESSGAALHVLHVLPGRGDEHRPREADRERQAHERLAAALDAERQLRLRPEQVVARGAPHAAICDYAAAHDVGLIVMGTHGRTGLVHLALGSVAERVLRAAPCPVVVVPRQREEEGDESGQGQEEIPQLSLETSPALDLLQRARALRATDIHIDPIAGGESGVRFRIDGRLEHYCNLDAEVSHHLLNRFKLLGNLDITEPFLPQEGRLQLPEGLRELEARVTTAPVAGGEALALRLLARESVFFPLTQLGFSPQALESVRAMLQAGEGLVLITGPTGAGKTTTVYSMLQTVAGEAQNIVSIEDPVEYSAPFVRQLSVDERHGITMTGGLKTILRMDPDVVFLGEIRDAPAAAIAMRAASSGKYIFSTLHTRSVASTVTALRDLGIDDRSLAGNLTGIINQRLVRRLCTDCRRGVEVSDEARQAFAEAGLALPERLFERGGCPACRETGYRGRIGVFEVALIAGAVAARIAAGAPESDIEVALSAAGMTRLQTDALGKVAEGTVDLREALAVHWLA